MRDSAGGGSVKEMESTEVQGVSPSGARVDPSTIVAKPKR